MYLPQDGHHFIGISGKHLRGYYNVDPALPDVAFIAQLTKQLVEPFKDDGVETVFAPAIGAIQWLSGPIFIEQLSSKPVLGVWADKVKPRGFVIKETASLRQLLAKRCLSSKTSLTKCSPLKS